MSHLPHTPTAEKALVASLLYDPQGTSSLLLAKGLVPESFYEPKWNILAATILRLVDAGKPIDAVTVADDLRSQGELDRVGGFSVLGELATAVANPGSEEGYADIVLKDWTARKVLLVSGQLAELARQPQDSADALSAQAEQLVFTVRSTSTKEVSRKESLMRAIDQLERAHSGQASIGLSTGLRTCDLWLCGLRPGTLNVLAARPGVGKTTLGMQIADKVANDGVPVMVASYEMTADELNLRALCADAKVNSMSALKGEITEGDVTRLVGSAGRLSRSPLHIIDAVDTDVRKLRAVARRMHSQKKLGLILVDYIQLVPPTKSAGSRREEVDEVSRSLKCMALELKVPVLALSQLNRDVERDNRRPRLADLRESGSIEQDADTVSFLWASADPNPDGSMRIAYAVAKNRGARVGDGELLFRPDIGRFFDLSPQSTLSGQRKTPPSRSRTGLQAG